MPMPAKGPRLFARKRSGRDTTWVIKDTGGIEVSTRTVDRREAEIQLGQYIARKNRASGPAGPEEIAVADVLAIYGEEHAPTVASPQTQGYAIDALLPYWGESALSSIKGETCRRYAKSRKHRLTGAPIAAGTIRRELNVLQAAINYCYREGYTTGAPQVTLPKMEETNQRALTRDEVAKLLRAARRTYRCGHVVRFILVSIYTGTRKSAALNLRLSGPATTGGWFDLDDRILYRIGEDERSTKKRRTPARIPRQLVGHARRWVANGDTWAVQFEGGRVADLKNAWATVVAGANLGWRPTPHTLKHTAITWAIRGGASIPDAAAFFATSVKTIEDTYWHLSPDFQQGAISAIEGKR